MGRVADADVVEDGLTEDVPSSMVGYQKSRRHLYVVKSQDRFGKATGGGGAMRLLPVPPPASVSSCMEKTAENSIENGE